MGRFAAWTLVAVCAFSCSPTVQPPASGGAGGGGRGGSEGGSVGEAGARAPIDSGADDRPDDGRTAPSIDAHDAGNPSNDALGEGATGSDAAASPDGPAPRCPSGALLCEDFDKYASATELAAGWIVTTTAATLAVDATKPFGTTGKSLHLTAAAGTPTAVIIKDGAPLLPISGNVMYGRMMMWLTQTPGGNYHWNNIQAAGTIPGSTRYGKYGWGGQAGKVLAGYTVRDTPTGAAVIDCSKPSASAIPEKTWVCVEWKFDGAANELHYWFDGVLLADVDVITTGTRCVNAGDLGSTWQAPAFANLSVGWQQYQASTGALEFWVDELVVATQKIGCPSP
jgi:hypothetical protein